MANKTGAPQVSTKTRRGDGSHVWHVSGSNGGKVGSVVSSLNAAGRVSGYTVALGGGSPSYFSSEDYKTARRALAAAKEWAISRVMYVEFSGSKA